MTQRHCGSCTLCCKLLPMKADAPNSADRRLERFVKHGLADVADFAGMLRDFDKPAGQRCPYQKHHKGCTVYKRRPFGCRVWACRWLTGDDTADLSRPDRAHYVIDESPDFVTTENGDKVPVIQIWVDPSYRDAHRDPALRAYLLRRMEATRFYPLVRFGSYEAMILFREDGQWHEKMTNMRMGPEHSIEEKEAAGLRADPEDARKRLAWALDQCQ